MKKLLQKPTIVCLFVLMIFLPLVVAAQPAPPVADFSTVYQSGNAPLIVAFRDYSTNGADAWSWDFGDGGTSTLRHPVHIYRGVGSFIVTLTASNQVGSDSETKFGYITVSPFTGTFSRSTNDNRLAVADSSGLVFAWGYNLNSRVGSSDSTSLEIKRPVKVVGGAYGTGSLGDNSGNKIIKLAIGTDHTLALARDGTVYSWGDNSYGQLGDGSTAMSNMPVRVLQGVYSGTNYLGDDNTNRIISVSAGNFLSAALAEDGTVYAWGDNGYGASGDSTTINRSTPVRVWKGDYNGIAYLGDDPNNKIIALSTGGSHIALAANGTVYTWGYNFYGTLGNNTSGVNTEALIPVQVMEGVYSGTGYLGDDPTNKIIAVSGGSITSYAVAEDGSVYSWGDNGSKGLGNILTGIQPVPTLVLQGEYIGSGNLGSWPNNKIISINAGNTFAIAVAEDGTAYSWGTDAIGAGGTIADADAPKRVLAGAYSGHVNLGGDQNNKIIAIGTAFKSGYAVTADGLVYSWGDNSKGTLGDNTTTAQFEPVTVHNWDGSGSLDLTPPLPSPGFKSLQLSGSAPLIVAFRDTSSYADSWSWDFGDGGTSTLPNPVNIYRSPGTYTVILTTYNSAGPASETKIDYITVSPFSGNLGTGAHGSHKLVADSSGLVFSWGGNTWGQVGDSTLVDKLTPVKVMGGAYGAGSLGDNSANKIIKLAQGIQHSIALAQDGTVYAWGDNLNRGLGDSTITDPIRRIPLRVLKGVYNGNTFLGDDPNNKIISVAAGWNSLALAEDGTVYSWGPNNDFGQLGDSTTVYKSVPVRVWKGDYNGTTYLGDNPNNKIIALTAGEHQCMALAADGTVYSWGDNTNSVLGSGDAVTKLVPIQVMQGVYPGTTYLGDEPDNKIIAVVMSHFNSYAVAQDGKVYSWGKNDKGQLGNSLADPQDEPTSVLQGEYPGTGDLGSNSNNKIISISAGQDFVHTIAGDGMAYGWGKNTYGYAGDGLSANLYSPKLVKKGVYLGTTNLGDNSINKIIAIGHNSVSSFAVTADGLVYSWGENYEGSLGNSDPNLQNQLTPVPVTNIGGAGVLDLTPPFPIPGFRSAQLSGSAPLIVAFRDASYYATGYSWTFGDGGTSTESNPVHVYQSAGTYTIVLTISNSAGSASERKTDYITVSPFWGTLSNGPNGSHKLVADSSGLVFAWGGNASGQVGDSTLVDKFTSVKVMGGAYGAGSLGDNSANKIIKLANGIQHSLALAQDGTVYAWGDNLNRGLGDSTNTNLIQRNPLRVLKGAYNGTTYLGDDNTNKIISVAAGSNSLALAEDGTVYSWGSNNANGQLGDSTTVDKSVPVRVWKGAYNGTTYLGDNPDNKIIALTAGDHQCMALAADGTVYSWGDNTNSVLGSGDSVDRLIPIQVLKGAYSGTTYLGDDPANKIILVSMSDFNSYAVEEDGKVYSWGRNDKGQLGNGLLDPQDEPTSVLQGEYQGTGDLGSNSNNKIISISAGQEFVHTIAEDGMAYGWGKNTNGYVGDGLSTNLYIPKLLKKGTYSGTTYLGDDPNNKIIAIGHVSDAGYAVIADGLVYSWGKNSFGCAGNNTIIDQVQLTPGQVHYLSGGAMLDLNPSLPVAGFRAAQLSGNAPLIVAFRDSAGYASEWSWTFGDGETSTDRNPVHVYQSAGTYTVVQTASNTNGSDSETKTSYITVGPFSGALGLGSFSQHSTAVDVSGIVLAWGKNNYGQLGDSTIVDKFTPVKVLKGAYAGAQFLGDDPANPLVATAKGARHTLALAKDGIVYAWGNNSFHQLGQGPTGAPPYSWIPVKVVKGDYSSSANFLGSDSTNKIIAIAVGGDNFSLALAEDGIIYAWGKGADGRLAYLNSDDQAAPIQVRKGDYSGNVYLGDDPNSKIIGISAGWASSLALAADGNVYSWGLNTNGQLGDNSIITGLLPVRVQNGLYGGTAWLGDDQNNKIIKVSAGAYGSSFALAEDGTVYSWGYGGTGSLGNGNIVDHLVPVRVLKGFYGGTTYLGDLDTNKVISVEAGSKGALAMTADGCVFSWGPDTDQELGDGVTTDVHTTPVKVLKGIYDGTLQLGDTPTNPMVQIAPGDRFGMALGSDLFIYAWGANDVCQLGDSTIISKDSPVLVKAPAGVPGDLQLPVELSSFTALPGDCQVTLNWVTQSEMENLGFIVERSPEEDGIYLELSSFSNNSELRGQGTSATAAQYSYVDNDVENGQTYYYKLADVDINGIKTYSEPISVKLSVLPKVFQLYQNYPNPFNPQTTIKYDVPSLKGKTVQVNITIYNMLGQVVRKLYVGKKTAGVHTITWNGANEYGGRMSSGVYFMVFKAGDFSQRRKMMLMQ